MNIRREGLLIPRRFLFSALLSGLVLSPIRVGWAQQINAGSRAEYQMIEGRSNDVMYLQSVIAF